MSYVELKNIKKRYENGYEAISDASIEIEQGEFVILLGPSGCGKSTLLRMVAGLESITEGGLIIDNTIVNNALPKDRDIAMVFQSYALYPHMSVYDNMALALKIQKMDKKEVDEKVRDIADMLNLTDFLDVKPGQLSGGQRQRVALGRAIVRRPKLFLFDEPLSNLDAKLRTKMRQEISALHKEINATIMYVTHDQVEAMTMGDKVVVLNSGIIQQIGSPKDLYERPTNKFVASFIGTPIINFIDVDVRVESDKIILSRDDIFYLELPNRQFDNLWPYHGKNISLGVRPEDLSICIDQNQGFVGKFGFTEYLGSECNISIKLNNDEIIMLRTHSNRGNLEGEARVIPNIERLHFFDSETEQCI